MTTYKNIHCCRNKRIYFICDHSYICIFHMSGGILLSYILPLGGALVDKLMSGVGIGVGSARLRPTRLSSAQVSLRLRARHSGLVPAWSALAQARPAWLGLAWHTTALCSALGPACPCPRHKREFSTTGTLVKSNEKCGRCAQK